MKRHITSSVLTFALLAILASGCVDKPQPVVEKNGATEVKSQTPSPEQEKGAPKEAPKEEEKVAFKLGDLCPEFTPPPLEELEKKVEWIDRPVRDPLAELREAQKDEKPNLTAKQALELKNDSPENNAKLLEFMRRVATNDAEADFEASINRHSGGDVNSLFPLFQSSAMEQEVLSMTDAGLFSFDKKLEFFASKDSVVSWQTSKDGLYDKVVLRDDMTWSDDKPITAHDVEYAYRVIMTKAVPVKAVRQGTDQMLGVHAYDDHTLVFFHRESLATNSVNVLFPIIPKHVFEKSLPADPALILDKRHIELGMNPIVGGSYYVSAREPGQSITLERRESYYMHNGKQVRDKPYFKTIRFRILPEEATALLALKAGDLDEMILTTEQWRNQTNEESFYKLNTKVYDTEWTSFHFIWNMKDPRFADKRVRWAMTYAFDHRELLDKLLYKMCAPCTGTFHPSSQWAPRPSPKPVEQDLDKAEALLDEAGWVDSNGDGIRDKMIDGKRVDFEFTVLTSNRPERIDFCNLLKESLDQIGVKCNVNVQEFAAVISKLDAKEFQACFGGWGTGADPDTSENIYGTGAPRNYGNYTSAEVDKLFAEGKKELDQERRAEIYRKIALQLWDDQPYTWLYYRNAFYGFNKSLRGYDFSPRGPFSFTPGFGSVFKATNQ